MKRAAAVLGAIIFAVPVLAQDDPTDLNARIRPDGLTKIVPGEEAQRIYDQCGEQEGFRRWQMSAGF